MNINNERYQRQVILKGFGQESQYALAKAKVLVIGAGGLGCPVLQYLTAAGVGYIGIVDDDLVSITNLHRQVLYDTKHIGKPKVKVAADKLRLMNPDITITEYIFHLDKYNCLDIINEYDIVVDCTDNFSSRYLINDACVIKGKPLVHGAVNRFEGQVAVFNALNKDKKRTSNYRDLFPEQPASSEVMNCAETGVLGVLPGIIGSMQANETIKLITGIGEPLINCLLTYNTLNNQSVIFNYSKNEMAIGIPKTEKEFLQTNYEIECVIVANQTEINVAKFDEMLLISDVAVFDVREENELPLVNEFTHKQIPLGEIKNRIKELVGNNIIFFCQSGKRSLLAAKIAAEHFGNKSNCFSLRGGIAEWKKQHEKQMA